MNKKTVTWALLAITSTGLAACGSSTPPTVPPPPTTLPALPPTTTTTTLPPFAAACGSPSPPPLYGFKLKVQTDSGFRKLVDSRPIVLNTTDGYCGKTGQGNGKYCDTRLEGDLQREACDALVVGKAKDTGRYGPTWSFEGQPCSAAGNAQGAGCINHDTNQFMVVGRGSGLLLACASEDVPLATPDSRCGGCGIDPASLGCH